MTENIHRIYVIDKLIIELIEYNVYQVETSSL